MKVKIRDIEREEEGLKLEGELLASSYDLEVAGYTHWQTIQYSLLFQIVGAECLVQGKLDTNFQAQCGRCLELLPWKVEVHHFQHSYSFKTHGDVIDLTNEIREDILLHLPLVTKCTLDLQGKCPYTGESFQEKERGFSVNENESIWPRLEDL